ncbi:MAG: hypothetical protein IIW11_06765 [Bacteroidales bacterium]|nr:hypothetical protein [Bacteroidales bacterium]
MEPARSGFAFLIMLLMIIGVIALIVSAIKNSKNQPTMKGVIISLIFGLLPLYLILCVLGIMGEERNKFDI